MPETTPCEVRIREVLDEKWKGYFAPFTLTVQGDQTLLTGVVHDQAELFGLLLKIRDLGLSLVSFSPLPPDCCEPARDSHKSGGTLGLLII